MIILTTTSPGRSGMLHAVLSRAMALGVNNEFVIQHYGDIDETPLRLFADLTGNIIQFNRQPDDRSVCHTKRAFEPKTHQQQWLNLDDDIFLHKDVLSHHHITYPDSCLSTGVVDITNGRGYAHWTLGRFDVGAFPFDQALIGYFRFSQCLVFGGHLRTQLYSLPMNSLTSALWGPVESKYTKKGVRGYDIALFNAYRNANKFTINHMTGLESMHLGVDTPFLNKDWTSHVT